MITNNKSMGQQTMEHMFRGSTGIIVVGFRVQVGPDQPKTSWRSLISNKSSAKMTHLRNTREKSVAIWLNASTQCGLSHR